MLKRLSGSLYFDHYHDHYYYYYHYYFFFIIIILFLLYFFCCPIIKFLWLNQSQGTLDIQINTRYSQPLL